MSERNLIKETIVELSDTTHAFIRYYLTAHPDGGCRMEIEQSGGTPDDRSAYELDCSLEEVERLINTFDNGNALALELPYLIEDWLIARADAAAAAK